jgi:hypothetical protein
MYLLGLAVHVRRLHGNYIDAVVVHRAPVYTPGRYPEIFVQFLPTELGEALRYEATFGFRVYQGVLPVEKLVLPNKYLDY